VTSITRAMLGLHLTGVLMSEHVYKTIELVGSSTRGMEDAVQRAITKAAETVRNLRWFEVVDTRGHLEGGKVAHWQVTLKVGFTLEED
jgi:dodecin